MRAQPPTEPASSAPGRLLSAPFARVTLANFFFFLTFASFFLLPLRVRALGGSERAVGLVMGTAGVAALASVALVGPLLDRVDRRVFLRAGLVAMAVVSAAFVLVERVGPLLFVLRVAQGVAFAIVFNAASTMAAEFAVPGRRAAALGVFGISTLTTHALAPALGEVLVAWAGFEALFLAAAGFSLVGLGVAGRLPSSALHPAAGRSERLRPTMALGVATGTVALCGVAFGTVITYVPTFVVDAQLGPVAVFFLAYTAAAVLTRLGLGGLGDTVGRARMIRPALALLVVSILALAAVGSALALVAAGLLFGTAQGVVYPTLNAFAIDQSEPGQLGRVQTLYNGAFNLGTTAGSMGFGAVANAWGHRSAFVCAAGAAAVALVVFALAGKESPPPA
jgi:MFS family permease